MMTTKVSELRAWAEVDHGALVENYRYLRRCSLGPRTPALMAVVKANAYGHGLTEVARTLCRLPGLAFLGVANVAEARSLQEAGIEVPKYLLGPCLPKERAEIVQHAQVEGHQWTPCISSWEEAAHYEELARDVLPGGEALSVHLALDTGMGRGGFPEAEWSDLPTLLGRLAGLAHVRVDGLASHLPCGDEDVDFTKGQMEVFGKLAREADEACERLGYSPVRWVHLCNSAGILGYQEVLRDCGHCCNLHRPGLALYGISPLPDEQAHLRPVLTLKSRVTLVRELPKGHGISYGRTHILKRATRVATVGIGYGDGYPRHLSGRGAAAWFRGHHLPLLGRVTMDQIMLDATDVPDLQPGDELELFGPHIMATELAERAGTIPWEILTRITARVPRYHHSYDWVL